MIPTASHPPEPSRARPSRQRCPTSCNSPRPLAITDAHAARVLLERHRPLLVRCRMRSASLAVGNLRGGCSAPREASPRGDRSRQGARSRRISWTRSRFFSAELRRARSAGVALRADAAEYSSQCARSCSVIWRTCRSQMRSARASSRASHRASVSYLVSSPSNAPHPHPKMRRRSAPESRTPAGDARGSADDRGRHDCGSRAG